MARVNCNNRGRRSRSAVPDCTWKGAVDQFDFSNLLASEVAVQYC